MQRKYLFIFLPFLLVGCLSEDKKIYDQLIEKYEAYEKLEEDNFKKLTFSLSEKNFLKSAAFKVILKDQLGRNWMFKGNDTLESSASDGAVTAYRIYNLFGVNVPETHHLIIKVNGKDVPGHIQLFIPNIGTFEKNEVFWSLGPQEQLHGAKNHLLSWLIANHHVHQGQFLVSTGDQGLGGNRLFRVDNSIQWFLIGRDPFDINYQPPNTWEIPNVGYYRFWRAYLNKRFDFFLQEVFEWADFISKFPDKKYSSFFSVVVENKLRHIANNGYDPNDPYFLKMYPDLYPLVDEKTFMPTLLKRKKNLLKEISPFYSKLQKIRGESALQRPDKESIKRIGNELSKKIDEKINYQKEIQRKIGVMVNRKEVNIEFSTSHHAYATLRWIVSCYTMKRVDRCVQSMIKKLEKIKSATTHPLERQALDNALVNLEYVVQSYQKGLVYDRWQLLQLNRFFEKTDYWKKPLDKEELRKIIDK